VALTCAAAASPAAALAPGRSGFYGGGAVRDYFQFVSVRVLPGGGFSAHATLVTKCSPRFGDSLTESFSVPKGRLSGGGRYGATFSFSEEADPGIPAIGGLHAEGTVSFSLRILHGGVTRGIARVRTTYSDPATGAEVSRCDTGRVAWSARRPPRNAGEGRPAARAGVQRGVTGQGEPFLMRVANEGRSVRRAGLTARVECPSATGLPLDVVAHGVRVRRGRFGAADEFRRDFTQADGTELVERYSWELRGRFGRTGTRGSFSLKGVVSRRSDGARVDSCDTGTIAWRSVP
jgi:hypothetical protein